MAPKTPAASLLSHQPSKEKPENENPSSSDEEEDDADVEGDTEEEGEDSDQTEEGSSDEEEEDTDLQKVEKSNKTLIPAAAESDAKPIAQGDDSDSDPDSEGSPSDYKMQPIPKPAATLAKRANPEGDVTQTPLRSCKKSKTEDGKANPSSSTPGFITRLWTNDDEIAVLNGMIDFKSQKRVDPGSDLGDFHGFVKGKLHADFSKEQLKTKISRLKKRFVTALKRFEHNRSEPSFTKQVDEIAFQLSKKIWGASISISKGGKKTTATKRNNGKGKDAAAAVREKEAVKEQNGAEEADFWSKYKNISESFDNMAVKFPSFAMSSPAANAFKEKLSSIGNADAKQLDDKWRKLIMEEIELNYKMLDLMTQQFKMALNK
ncbi:hypothetical protein ABFS83_08G111900 [Erythranthe nasuta]